MFKELKRQASVSFDLCAAGPVLVSSGTSNKTNPTLPDNTFMRGYSGKDHEENYVIPGSTIKGVIRHYLEDNMMLNETEAQTLFGKINNSAQKSKIKFSDAYADKYTVVSSIRHSTAIDPRVQSAKGGTLNNMEVVEQGVFKASFSIRNFTDSEMEKLLIALFDINSGAVRFGGRKSRGFGQMKTENFVLTSFDGYDESFNKMNEKSFDDIEKAIEYFRGVK